MDIVPTPSPAQPMQCTAGDFFGLVGQSQVMLDLYARIRRAAASDAPVLILGESGTGKELVAAALHALSRRSSGPMVAFNCSALSAAVVENELFGHTKGAYTGAENDAPGLIAAAHRGTLFIDELATMHLDVQPKLLRVLETTDVRPVGSTISQRIDFRLITATNVSLQDEATAGRFRADLRHRVERLILVVPPLSERLDDLPLLVRHFLGHIAKSQSIGPVEISGEAMALLQQYRYEGNVRELLAVVERVQFGAENPRLITREDVELYAFPRSPFSGSEPVVPAEARDDDECLHLQGRTLAQCIREVLIRGRRRAGGNKRQAARELDVDRDRFPRDEDAAL